MSRPVPQASAPAFLLLGLLTALSPAGAAPARPTTPEAVARAFVLAFRGGDKERLRAVVTRRAWAMLSEGSESDPADKKDVPFTLRLGRAAVRGARATVPITLVESGKTERSRVLLRREGGEWRAYAVAAPLGPGQPDLTIDFERPEEAIGGLLQALAGGLKQGFESMAAEGAREEDRAFRQVAPFSADRYQASWQTRLGGKTLPAGEALRRLSGELRLTLRPIGVPAALLTRPVAVPAGARFAAVEAVCARVGLYPAYEQKALTVRPGRRKLPAAAAGPFLVEMESLEEYPPYATGRLVLRLLARGLPPEVAALEHLGGGDSLPRITVTAPDGRDLLDSGTSVMGDAGGEVRTVELPLAHLEQSVAQIARVEGTLSVRLPVRVASVRLAPLRIGAAGHDGPLHISVARLRPGPVSELELNFRGAPEGGVHVQVYDAGGRPLTPSTYSMQSTNGAGRLTLRVEGRPVAAAVRSVLEQREVTHPFRLGPIPLAAYARMPTRVEAPRFDGHPEPLGVEFDRVERQTPFARVHFRAMNHTDRPVRSLELRLAYLDGEGRTLEERTEWLHGERSPGKPPLLLPASAPGTLEVRPFSLPAGTARVAATVRSVTFVDATTWRSP